MLKGSLFTQNFLQEGITEYDEWEAITEQAMADFRGKLLTTFDRFPTQGNPIEATTEHDLIEPVLQTLGWDHFLTQQTTSRRGRSDIPDYLLFENSEAKQRAQAEDSQYKRYRHGLAVLEAKAWNVLLDRKGKQTAERVPSNQIIRYLTSVDVQSDGKVQWGLLTNGRLWRIYYNRAKSKSEEYLEIDLPLALRLPGFQASLTFDATVDAAHALRLFYLLFRCSSFARQADGQTLHEQALEGGRFWEAKVADNLSHVVFESVYPALLQALRDCDPEAPDTVDNYYLQSLRDNGLKLLYRLLFVLYAEDRRLLPTFDEKYDDYGLHKRLREDIAQRLDHQDVLSTSRDNYWHHAQELFRSIDQGDESIGLPPYNGGLFRTREAALLNRVRLPDATFAPLLDQLSRREENGVKQWINYRDLSVQQLGSIYERLLEYRPVVDAEGVIVVQPNIFARKTSGSYYTPENLVKVILERTVGPLLKERRQKFEDALASLTDDRRSRADKNKVLQSSDPAEAMLTLKICDPAMGSGHFLVSLVDFLADRILEAIDETETLVPWADEEQPYVSPVVARIQFIRERIREQAQAHRWLVQEEQLDDKHIIRRMILKRCVYGVDKNPMAVELAKVALWLHTFTVGAPLSFLDHHLRGGDSLFGEWVGMVQDELDQRGALLSNQVIQSAKQAAAGMQRIEQITDADVAEVKDSAARFEGVERATNPLYRFLNLYHALRWVGNESKEDRIVVNAYLDGTLGDPVKIATSEITINTDDRRAREFAALLAKARTLIDDNQFLHWEVAFPSVWDKWESPVPEGGFDAVIGNPPWDKMKLDPVEWFLTRNPTIAQAANAAKRKSLISQLEETGDELWNQYEYADFSAKTAMLIARQSGQYPLLSSGDIDLYSLFVERAHKILKPDGIVGLLVPSGIAANKTAAAFFKSISTSGQLSTLLDFENKKVFFPDVHASFKFCIYVAGGSQRIFSATEMAFFLHSTNALNEYTFALAPEDFARVNPNTGTAPIFRTQRDADITRRIYENFPVLHDHQHGKVWPVKYFSMFHMSGDSGLFKTAEELEAEGFYPTADMNKRKKGEEIYVPLYVGKMISFYDHRANSVVVNENNLKVTASSRSTTLEEYQDVNFLPQTQYFVPAQKVLDRISLEWFIAFRDIARSTDARTFIPTIIPNYACNHKLPLLIPSEQEETYANYASLILANTASLPFDFVARSKIQSTNMTWYVVEQLPLIPPEAYQQPLGTATVADFIKEQVLHLTYTAHDLAPFARDMGYDGEPFVWDEEDRRHRRAKLDALFFTLYGLDEDEAEYVLSTFPIVQRHDERDFGRYRTRDLILNYMRALRAGDTEVTVQG